ncbi:MAG: vWA domain-containing protein [Bacillota bacterium]
MFVDFFFALRTEGIPVSITEWMILMEALDKGMANASLTGFYYLARSILVKSESYFDQYDLAFQRYFRDINNATQSSDENQEISRNSSPRPGHFPVEFDQEATPRPPLNGEEEPQEGGNQQRQEDDEEQAKEEGGGGQGDNPQWAGSEGDSPIGFDGSNPEGIRWEGRSSGRSAMKVASERLFKDYRTDEILGVRQFEQAFRRLRQLTRNNESPMDQLDLDGTIDETCRNAGFLKLVMTRERKNNLKVVVAMDVGGSMEPYIDLCNKLFTAVNRAAHFKDLKFYYFHNCIYERLYASPSFHPRDAILTAQMLRTLKPDYKIIILGDACMAPGELVSASGNVYWGENNADSGMSWLQRISRYFTHAVWLNPIPEKSWDHTYGSGTIQLIREVFPMFELSVDGLGEAVKNLLVRGQKKVITNK